MKSIGTKEIRTERLVLRRFSEEDINDVYENYGSDPLVNRYIDFAPCSTLEGADEFIRMHVDRYDTDSDFYGWAITLDGVVIGSIGLFDVCPDKESAEIGYSLGSRWWGTGLATEAAKAVIDFAFNEIELKRVYGSHHPENIGSGKVMMKASMKYEGEDDNLIYYGLERD